MGREFVDLLTFPERGGGGNGTSGLVTIGTELNYSTIGVCLSRNQAKRIKLSNPKLELVPVASRGGGGDAIRFASGRKARKAASNASVDFVIPDCRDAVAGRFAAENDIPVAYPYVEILENRGVRRSSIIRDWRLMHRRLSKGGCREFVVSGARDPYLLRDPMDVASLAHSCLHIPYEEAMDWISIVPSSIIDTAKGRES